MVTVEVEGIGVVVFVATHVAQQVTSRLKKLFSLHEVSALQSE